MMQQQQQDVVDATSHHSKPSPSPSFSSYSSETLAEIAARVIEELRRDPRSLTHDDDDDDALFPPWQNDNHKDDEAVEQNDDDFVFASVPRDLASPVSADEIFCNGQIKAMYPVFGFSSNDAGLNVQNIITCPEGAPRRRRLPLRKLMLEEGETASCSSSTDESVDLEGVAEGAYCVWTPNSVGRERKKSNSTGSTSKRWKLRDLLLRSHSDRKHKQKQQQLLFQIPTNKVAAKPQNDPNHRTVAVGMEHPAEQNSRKPFLPSLRLFTNVNGLGRNLLSF